MRILRESFTSETEIYLFEISLDRIDYIEQTNSLDR